MATASKQPRLKASNSASSTIDINLSNLCDDHDFIAPNEICTGTIGLLHCLTTKRLINIPFSRLYRESQEIGWKELFTRERSKLRPNFNSALKALALNRLIDECSKDPIGFAGRLRSLHDAIEMRMTNTFTCSWAQQDLYRAVQAWRELQWKRRLFHFNHDEAGQPHSLFTLQQVASSFFKNLIHSSQNNPLFWQSGGRDAFLELFRHSLILVAQPSNPESMPAIKYEKCGRHHSAKVNTRIICLLDPDVVKNHLELSNIDVTIYLKDRHLDPDGEKQPALQCQIQDVLSADGGLIPFLFAELDSITLSKVAAKNQTATPLYNNHLCQMEFRTKIKLLGTDVEETLTITSKLFGICSHAQYFPQIIAKVLIDDVEQIEGISNKGDHVLQPITLTGYVCRYHTRAVGVDVTAYTRRFIYDQFNTIYVAKDQTGNATSNVIYEDILTKLISQIQFLVDHPVMSMMYYDGLFLGECDNTIDFKLDGSEDRPHMVVRFRSLKDHQPTETAGVRCVIHNGQLTRSEFHSNINSFADDMCRFVYESMNERAVRSRIFLSNRIYRDFSWYFDDVLYRLSSLSPEEKGSYKPLIPVLWTAMRTDNENRSAQSASNYTDPCLSICPVSPSIGSTTTNGSSIVQLQAGTANSTSPIVIVRLIQQSDSLNGQHIATNSSPLEVQLPVDANLAPDVIIHYLAEQLSRLCKSQNGDPLFQTQSSSQTSLTTSLLRWYSSSDRLDKTSSTSAQSLESEKEMDDDNICSSRKDDDNAQ